MLKAGGVPIQRSDEHADDRHERTRLDANEREELLIHLRSLVAGRWIK